VFATEPLLKSSAFILRHRNVFGGVRLLIPMIKLPDRRLEVASQVLAWAD